MFEQLNYMELQILDFIRENLSCAFGDFLMPLITLFGEGGIFWIALTLVLLARPKTRRLGINLAFCLALEALVCNVMIKPLVGRIRPYDLKPGIEALVRQPHDFSFPSGHTGASFAMAGGFIFSRSRYWLPVTILASLIALSRIYLYVHYPTDVIAGILLGLLTAFIGVKLSERLQRRIEAKER